MSSQLRLRLVAAAVTTAVTALAISQAASAQGYSNSDYGYGNGYGHSRTVRCESTNSRRTTCRVDTQGGVRIARQISHTDCLEGRTWGANSSGIWVSNGCRADFAIGSGRNYRSDDRYGSNRYGSNSYSGNGYNGYYSNGYNANYSNRSGYASAGDTSYYINNDHRNGDNVYSDSTYRINSDRDRDAGYGNSYAYNNGYAYGNGYTNRSSSTQIVRCDSTGDGRTYCRNQTTGAVTLGRTRSGNCTQGQTWGSDQRGIWVSGDCNADFSIGEDADDDSRYSGYRQ
jgi:hypothetical protein